MNITEEQNNILKAAIEKYGLDAQLDMVVEECSELIQAVQKYKRSRTIETVENILKEGSDVFIMLKQVELIFPNRMVKIQNEVDFKINRLKNRLNNK